MTLRSQADDYQEQALVHTPGKLDPLASVPEYVTVRDPSP
jgi:hypothetical protein